MKAELGGGDDGAKAGDEERLAYTEREPEPTVKANLCRPSTGRLWLGLLLCYATVVANGVRQNIAVTLNCMVNNTWVKEQARLAKGIDEAGDYLDATTWDNATVMDYGSPCALAPAQEKDYEVGPGLGHAAVGRGAAVADIRRRLLGFVTGLPAGWLSDRYGAKKLLLISIACHSVGALLTPVAAVWLSFSAVLAVRALVGLGQGIQMPAISTAVSSWYPAEEKSRVVAMWTAGNQISYLLGSPIAAYMCKLHIWPAFFYAQGALGLLWCVAWSVFYTNSPVKNRWIDDGERQYIMRRIYTYQFKNRKVAAARIPWKQMLLSPPIYANMLSNFAASLNMILFQSYLPMYYRTVLFLDLQTNGILSSVPYLVQFSFKMAMSLVADKLKAAGVLSLTTSCKAFNALASIGGGVFMAAAMVYGCEHKAVPIVCICASFACFPGFIGGFMTSWVSIAPAYSGIIAGFSKVSSQSGSVVVPYIVSHFVTEGSLAEWRVVYLICAGAMLASQIFYCFMASGEVQPWAMPTSDTAMALSDFAKPAAAPPPPPPTEKDDGDDTAAADGGDVPAAAVIKRSGKSAKFSL